MKQVILSSLIIFLSACTILQNDKVITIGGIAALTGSDSDYGLEDKKTAELRIKQINDSGGIDGRELQIIWKDGQCNGDIAAKEATKLIKEERVNIILGGTCSASTLGISKVTNENRILQVANGGSSSRISEAGEFTFRTIPSNSGEWKILHKYLQITGVPSLAVFQEDREYNNSLQEKLDKAYKGDIYKDLFSDEKDDFREFINTSQERGVDTFFINVYSKKQAKDILSQLVELEFDGKLLINSEVLVTFRSNIKDLPIDFLCCF